MLKIISLGAGVQSSTIALMASRGDLPTVDAAIFADTGAEPQGVYDYLDYLEPLLTFPVYRVSAGNLREQITASMRGEGRMDARPPFFTKAGGMLNRQCTQDFKIRVIHKKMRELVGLQPRQRGPKRHLAEQWIGISLDEAVRAKPSFHSYIVNRHPLLDLRMTRRECLAYLRDRQIKLPSKSACTFCPYRSHDQWIAMKDADPVSFEDACAIDEVIRPGVPGPRRPKGEEWFVHPKRVPLRDAVKLPSEPGGQPDLFNNECDGICGV